MYHPILTHLAAAVVGFIFCKIFSIKDQTFMDIEIVAITSEIEKIKAYDTKAYSTLMSEWKSFLGNEKAKMIHASVELKQIVAKVQDRFIK